MTGKNNNTVPLGAGMTGKRHEGTLWGEGNILYLYVSWGYTLCIYENSSNYTLKICAFHCKFCLNEGTRNSEKIQNSR